MWRNALAFILVPTLVWGQTLPQNPQTAAVAAPRPTYDILTEWQTIRQGSSEKVVLRFVFGLFEVVSPYEAYRDLIPLKIEFEESDGVGLQSFSFPSDRWALFRFHDEAMRKQALLKPPDESASSVTGTSTNIRSGDTAIESGRDIHPKFKDYRVRVLPVSSPGAPIDVTAKVNVARTAALGTHLLRGRIKYQPILDNGTLPPQETEIEVAIVVVDRDAKTVHNREYATLGKANSTGGPKHELVWMILLAPIFIPLWILSQIACGIRGEDCSC